MLPERMRSTLMLTLTHELIESGMTPRGAWTRAQLAVLGVSWPPRRGWKEALVGKQLSESAYGLFLEAARVKGKAGRTWKPGVEMLPGIFD